MHERVLNGWFFFGLRKRWFASHATICKCMLFSNALANTEQLSSVLADICTDKSFYPMGKNNASVRIKVVCIVRRYTTTCLAEKKRFVEYNILYAAGVRPCMFIEPATLKKCQFKAKKNSNRGG
jgi:hypothetical protein